MNLQNILSKFLFIGRKEEEKEHFFALNIGQQNLEASLWEVFGKHLKILQTATSKYSSLDEIEKITDRLLDSVLGIKELEPQKILFGVPDAWLSEDDLKEEYLKLLRRLVKDLELSPMAYVATTHAIVHFLEYKESVPTTAILIGFEEGNLSVTVSRAGKLDGSKIVKRSDNPGLDIEKALLTFTSVETLPSKILIYGQKLQRLEKLKRELLSFPWMSKLSFLHFPKIDILEEDLTIKSVCLAGAKEINTDVVFAPSSAIPQAVAKKISENFLEKEPSEDLGFMVGDVAQIQKGMKPSEESPLQVLEAEDFAKDLKKTKLSLQDLSLYFGKILSFWRSFRSKASFRSIPLWVGVGVAVMLLTSYLLLPKAHVKIFVEPQVLEKDAQVTADPKVKEVDEDAKIIPGQIVEMEVSGSGKGEATGKKEIGDPAKGTVIIYNKTFDSKSLSKGTGLISPNGLKFTLDVSVNVASQSATETGITFGKAKATVIAQALGADGNLPSGTDLTVANISSSQISAKAEGNFSGGTSKQVTVVSENDQQRLLAQVAGQLRKQAQQKLQESLKDKKILEEALFEEIVKKSFSKNINDQAADFSLNLTVRFKGTAFLDKDLKAVVSKLVDTQIPEGFQLNLSETETQADISKLEKDGKLIFLARFRAKLTPKLDLEKIKGQIKGKTPSQVAETLKKQEHILESEVTINPTLPSFLQRLPFLEKNITVEVGLK